MYNGSPARGRLLGFTLIFFSFSPGYGLGVDKTFGNHDFYLEFNDPYYCATGMYFSLSRNPLPVLQASSESDVYAYFARRLFRPNALLVELGIYPLPLAGAGIRAGAPELYERSRIADVSLIGAVTESVNFKEPWSISLFLGHVGKFKSPQRAAEGRGNVGFLCSYGYGHFKDNLTIADHWVECELKMKIDKTGNDRRLATSYRFGCRAHSSRNIKDAAYLSVYRDRTDFDAYRFSFVRNSCYGLRADCAVSPLELLMLTAEAGKKHPIKTKKRTYVIGLSLGVTWKINSAYSGTLDEDVAGGIMAPIIKPLILF